MLRLHVPINLMLITNKLFYVMNILGCTRLIQWNCCGRGKLPQLQSITLTVDNESIAIINIYRHPNQTTPVAIFDQLIYTLLNTFSKIIFVGDFNAHHSWWGCDYEDSTGKT